LIICVLCGSIVIIESGTNETPRVCGVQAMDYTYLRGIQDMDYKHLHMGVQAMDYKHLRGGPGHGLQTFTHGVQVMDYKHYVGSRPWITNI